MIDKEAPMPCSQRFRLMKVVEHRLFSNYLWVDIKLTSKTFHYMSAQCGQPSPHIGGTKGGPQK